MVDGRTRVKSRQARFEDGKLTSEAFEGELDRSGTRYVVPRRAYCEGRRAVHGDWSGVPPPMTCLTT